MELCSTFCHKDLMIASLHDISFSNTFSTLIWRRRKVENCGIVCYIIQGCLNFCTEFSSRTGAGIGRPITNTKKTSTGLSYLDGLVTTALSYWENGRNRGWRALILCRPGERLVVCCSLARDGSRGGLVRFDTYIPRAMMEWSVLQAGREHRLLLYYFRWRNQGE